MYVLDVRVRNEYKQLGPWPVQLHCFIADQSNFIVNVTGNREKMYIMKLFGTALLTTLNFVNNSGHIS